ncbi:MAG TPA: DUF2975 domain-containing protein [Desulfosporosinus sp.]
MIILGQKGFSGIVKYILDLVFVGGIGVFLSLPIALKWYLGLMYSRTSENYNFLFGFLFVTGIFALLIVNEIRKLLMNLNRGNPFIIGNVTSLNRIAISCWLITACYVIKIIFYNSFLTIIVAMVFIITGFFSIILAEVFRQAVEVKGENDLTI